MDERDYKAMNKQPKSESRMYSDDEVSELLYHAVIQGCDHWDEQGCTQRFSAEYIVEKFNQSIQPKTEALKEGLKPCPNHPDVLTSQCGICNGDFPKLEQPKTEEVERGWTITDRTVIDKQLEAIKTVMGTIKTKEQAIQFLKDSGIELEEQPTSPSIEKMAEERYPVIYMGNEPLTKIDFNKKVRVAFIEGYKAANNHLEELEKWTDVQCYHNNSNGRLYIFKDELLKKINELKNQS